jgi:hypothetical protein
MAAQRVGGPSPKYRHTQRGPVEARSPDRSICPIIAFTHVPRQRKMEHPRRPDSALSMAFPALRAIGWLSGQNPAFSLPATVFEVPSDSW